MQYILRILNPEISHLNKESKHQSGFLLLLFFFLQKIKLDLLL